MKILTQAVSDDNIGLTAADVDLKIVFIVANSKGSLEKAVHLQTIFE